MIRDIRQVETALGDGSKKPTASEKKIMSVVRKSIVAKKTILQGKKIVKKYIIIKRPGNGIAPEFLNQVMGKKAKKNIKKDTSIKWVDLQ